MTVKWQCKLDYICIFKLSLKLERTKKLFIQLEEVKAGYCVIFCKTNFQDINRKLTKITKKKKEEKNRKI